MCTRISIWLCVLLLFAACYASSRNLIAMYNVQTLKHSQMCQYFLFREHRDVRDEYNGRQHITDTCKSRIYKHRCHCVQCTSTFRNRWRPSQTNRTFYSICFNNNAMMPFVQFIQILLLFGLLKYRTKIKSRPKRKRPKTRHPGVRHFGVREHLHHYSILRLNVKIMCIWLVEWLYVCRYNVFMYALYSIRRQMYIDCVTIHTHDFAFAFRFRWFVIALPNLTHLPISLAYENQMENWIDKTVILCSC